MAMLPRPFQYSRWPIISRRDSAGWAVQAFPNRHTTNINIIQFRSRSEHTIWFLRPIAARDKILPLFELRLYQVRKDVGLKAFLGKMNSKSLEL